ncbi:hypothetical protein EI94DRAFT_1539140, partial [Lactarius quietus]
WDVTRYADKLLRKPVNSGTKDARTTETSLRKRYPLLNGSAAEVPISRPCIVVDMHGVILAWYLPGILRDSRQREMMEATEKLHPLLGKHQGNGSWRNNPEIYCSKTMAVWGSLNISPAWFQQVHETMQDWPEAAAIFRKPAALEWLDAISQSNSILSAILAVIHPPLHKAGQETFHQLRQHADIQPQDVLRQWTSVFNSVA